MGIMIDPIFIMVVLFATPHSMPPLEEGKHHISDYGARADHPTSYNDDPPFKGPLILKDFGSPDYYRRRIRGYYKNTDELKISLDKLLSQRTPSCSTSTIIKAIIDHLARTDAPVDVKEVVESTEFYLRTAKRLIGAAKRVLRNSKNRDKNSNGFDTVTIYDLCCGHGLLGMLFVACNPPRGPSSDRFKTVLIDQSKPKSHDIVRHAISEVCPWVSEQSVTFLPSSLEAYMSSNSSTDECDKDVSIIISTHACGSLSDNVIEFSVGKKAVSVAVMPCCYTGTDVGAPYGVKRMLGVSLSADIRRSFYLQQNGYHVDFATIPRTITPMNRIIVAEQRK